MAGKKFMRSNMPEELTLLLAERWEGDRFDSTLLQLNGRLGNPEVMKHALKVVVDDEAAKSNRSSMLKWLQQFGDSSVIVPLLPLLGADRPEWLQVAAMNVLSRYSDDRIGKALIDNYRDFGNSTRSRARRTLFGRTEWALLFLKEIDGDKIAVDEVTQGEVNILTALKDEQISELVGQHWGAARDRQAANRKPPSFVASDSL